MSLLFRKDIQHEGEKLSSNAEKEILTFNVWSIDQTVKQIVRIRFENDSRVILISANKIRDNPTQDNLLCKFINR